VARIRPALAAFFGCLYYGALRPEEAIVLRLADCDLPRHGWGTLTLIRAAPRTAKAQTGTGSSHEQRGLKHRPESPSRPSWSAMLHHRLRPLAGETRSLKSRPAPGTLSPSLYVHANVCAC
jgi:hypothetical protein